MIRLLMKMTRTILMAPILDATFADTYRNLLQKLASVPGYAEVVSDIIEELKPGPIPPSLKAKLRVLLRHLRMRGIVCQVDLKSHDVVLRYVQISGKKVIVVGLVRSESRPGTWHVVTLYFSRRRGYVLPSSYCTCEDYAYRGFPCKHIVKLKDFYITHLNDIYKRCEYLRHIVPEAGLHKG